VELVSWQFPRNGLSVQAISALMRGGILMQPDNSFIKPRLERPMDNLHDHHVITCSSAGRCAMLRRGDAKSDGSFIMRHASMALRLDNALTCCCCGAKASFSTVRHCGTPQGGPGMNGIHAGVTSATPPIEQDVP
jgi:hypothetical protein